MFWSVAKQKYLLDTYVRNKFMKSSFTFLSMIIIQMIHAQDFTISGRITDAASGEALIGVAIYLEDASAGDVSNEYGFYSLSLPQGEQKVLFSYLGYETVAKSINLKQNSNINIELSEKSAQLKEAVVTSKAQDRKVENKEMSVVKMDIETIKEIPVVFGEVDVIKTIALLPGIQQAEGSSGLNIRGGGQDQNLILLDEATVYNASHLLGFFSIFNGDAIKGIEVYKGGIPAKYGGRLASIIDVRMKDGNKKRFAGQGGIGLISSRLTLEGPIVKDKSSFMLSGRRSYADVFLAFSKDDAIKNNTLYFYDANLKANYELSEQDKLFVSGYFGRDVFGFTDNFRVAWGNGTGTIRWNHIFNQKLFANISAIYSNFDYSFGIKFAENAAFSIDQGQEDWNLKIDVTNYFSSKSKLYFGGQNIYHTFSPGAFRGDNQATKDRFNDVVIPRKFALESALYLDHKYKFNSRFDVRYGLRYSLFNNLGKGREFRYEYSDYGAPNASDTFLYKKGEMYNYYGNLEPRVALNYNLNKEQAVKASYNRTAQYIQQASNSANSLPISNWFSAGPNVNPQISDQVAAGYFRNFKNSIESSVEVYYKWMDQQVDFRNNAQLFFNELLDGELLTGIGRSYGTELYINKYAGKFTGFLSYTLSKTERKVNGINGNRWYRTNFDRRHNIALVLTREVTPSISLTGSFVYQSNNPITAPTASYPYDGNTYGSYPARNNVNDKQLDYHRLDLSINLDPNKNKGRNYKSTWNFSFYNVYARENAWVINFTAEEKEDKDGNLVQTGRNVSTKIVLFKLIPSFTWNFEF